MPPMNPNSDSDDGDEDFVPDGAEISASEEESDGSAGEEPEDDDASAKKKKARGKRGKKRKESPPPSKRLKTAVDADETPTWKKELVKAKREEDEKAKTDALWADFLKDTTPAASSKSEQKTEPPLSESVISKPVEVEAERAATIKATSPEEKVPEAAIASSTTKVFQPFSKPAGSAFGGRGGFVGASRGRGGLIAGGGLDKLLSGGRKGSILEQSKKDWSEFKKAEGIEEDLKQHATSRGSFVEKQDFLSRVDYRQFEKERAVRDINRRRQQ